MRSATSYAAIFAFLLLAPFATAHAEDACEIAKKACAEQQAKAGPYYQLIATTPKPNSVVPEWKVSIEPGRIALQTQFGQSECTWDPASVEKILDEGFDITITAAATSTSDTTTVSGFIQLTQGFGPNGDLGPQNYVEVRAKPGETVKDSRVLHLDPHLPNSFAKVGDLIYIDVGGCDAGMVTYTYEYRE